MTLYAARQVKLIAKGIFQRQDYRPKGKRKRQLYILRGLPVETFAKRPLLPNFCVRLKF